MVIRRIRPEEYKRCQALWAMCFEYRMKRSDWTPEALVGEARANPQTRQEVYWDRQWAAFEDDDRTMLSAMSVIPWEARFDGHTVRMDGVGGVVTLPEHRRRGCVRGLFGAALRAMYDEGALLSYLYPFSTAFYGRFGYAPGCDWTLWKLALAGIPDGEVSGRYARIERGRDEQGRDVLGDLRAIDAARQARYNLMTVDGDMEYRWAATANPCAQREYGYVYYAAGGAPKGYASWVPEMDGGDRALNLKRFSYADREGLEALLKLLKRLSADHSHALIRLPCDVDLKGVLPEWSFGFVRRTVEFRGMVRAVNAPALLKLRRARGRGVVRIAIEDEQIPENNGCFRVAFGDGEENLVARTDDAPDVSMDIRAFSRAICGLDDGVDPEWQPGVKLTGDPGSAQDFFCRRPCYIEQYF